MLGHCRISRQRGVDRAPVHGGHGLLEIFDALRFQRADFDLAGVVHQHIDTTEALLYVANEVLSLLANSNVTAKREDLGSVSAQPMFRLV